MTAIAAAAGLLLGVIVGSFLAVVAIRWERGEGVVRGRSRCDACGRRLPAGELVPLLSYARQRGRCRGCAAPIDPRHPLIEAAAGVVGGVSLALRPDLAGLAGALFGWALLLLATLDLRCFWLPDRITWPLLAAGLAAGWLGLPPTLVDRAIGAAAGFVAFALVRGWYRWRRGQHGLGGGDPKLMAAIGAWLGWMPLPWVVVAAAVAGLCWFGWRYRRDPAALAGRLPLGTLLAAAAWGAWLVMAGWVNS